RHGSSPTWTVFVEFDRPIKGGSSGGPVIDGRGRVVGIISHTSEPREGAIVHGEFPRPHLALPCWLWSRIAGASRRRPARGRDGGGGPGARGAGRRGAREGSAGEGCRRGERGRGQVAAGVRRPPLW